MKNNIKKTIYTIVIAVFLLPNLSFSMQPQERLNDPELEIRARVISQNLRCLTCPNESIDASESAIARDLRLMVRYRLLEGDSDAQIYDFISKRFGDHVLFKPPIKQTTYLLWFAPILLFIFGGVLAGFYLGKHSARVKS